MGSLSVGEVGASADWSSSFCLALSAYTLLIARAPVPRKIVLTPLAVCISQLNYVGKSYRTQDQPTSLPGKGYWLREL